MHCRALTEYDFDSWSNALRGFIEKGTQSLTDGINTLSMSAALDGAGGAASMSGAGNGSGNLQDEDEDEGDYASGEAELVKAIDLIARMAAVSPPSWRLPSKPKLTREGERSLATT